MLRWLAVAMGGLGIALSSAALALEGLSGPPPGDDPLVGVIAAVQFGLVPAVTAPLAGLIAVRRPSHPVGWLLGGVALLIGLSSSLQAYAQYGLLIHPRELPGDELAVWVGSWIWPLLHAPEVLLLLVFPTGALPSSRWRFVAWAGLSLPLLLALISAITPGPLHLSETQMTPSDNSTGLALVPLDLALQLIQVLFQVLLLALLAAVGSLVLRFRQAHGVERQQLKWLVYATSLFTATQVVQQIGVLGRWGQVATNAAGYGIPFAIPIAVVRYHVFEIDRIINRTLVYGALSAVLALVYWGGVVLLQRVLQPLTAESDLGVVAGTLAVAALFQPLRRWIQRVVDQRFYRQQYDARRTLEAFTSRLREEIDLTSLEGELIGVVNQAVHPAHASVWLRRA